MKKNLQLGLIIVFGYAMSAAWGYLQKQAAATFNVLPLFLFPVVAGIVLGLILGSGRATAKERSMPRVIAGLLLLVASVVLQLQFGNFLPPQYQSVTAFSLAMLGTVLLRDGIITS